MIPLSDEDFTRIETFLTKLVRFVGHPTLNEAQELLTRLALARRDCLSCAEQYIVENRRLMAELQQLRRKVLEPL